MTRSILYVPALRPDRAVKAWSYGPDAVIIDLEDAVPAERKDEARRFAVEILAGAERPYHVRINAVGTPWWEADLEAVLAQPALLGIDVPKAESAETIAAIERVIADVSIQIFPILETVRGVLNAREIAHASPRIRSLTFGEGDFTLDLGLDWTGVSSSPTILTAMAQVVLESRLAGLEPPHDSVYPRLHDPAGLEASCVRGRAAGFGGKHAIHPEQLATIHRVFAPSDRALARARTIVERFDRALAEGQAAITVDGEFVDYPVYERARRVLGEEAKR